MYLKYKRGQIGIVCVLILALVPLLMYGMSYSKPTVFSHRFNDKRLRSQIEVNSMSDNGLKFNGIHGNGSMEHLSMVDKITITKFARRLRKELDVNKTKVSVVGTKTTYYLGDTVRLRITLHKQDGSPRRIGGDGLKVRIFEESLKAYACGRVVDHGNGTYTAIVKCLWTGNPTIVFYLAWMSEIPEIIGSVIATIQAIRAYHGIYRNGEMGYCHPFKSRLRESRGICNWTSRNGGMSFYCEKPVSRKQTCNDLDHFERGSLDTFYFLQNVFSFSSQSAPNPVTLKVIGKAESVEPSQKPCGLYNKTKLWTLQSPVGYFYKNQWKLLHCTPPPDDTIMSCLRHKHLVMYGDSTVRQWFVDVKNRFNCVLTTEKWTTPIWNRNSRIYCSKNNLTIDLVFHALPGNFDNKTRKFSSISRHIPQFYGKTEVIFLIQFKNHVTGYPLIFIQERINFIKKGIWKILEGNPDAKIFLKGAHNSMTFNDHRNDLIHEIYRQQFYGMRDKVIYLDNRDITFAKMIKDPHPPPGIVSVMVDQMLGYIC